MKMKQIIRYDTFETNSSSMHSLCLLNTNNEVQDIKNISVDFGEYGWGYDELTTPYEILSYFWTLVNELEVDNKYRKLLLEWFPDVNFKRPLESINIRNKVYYDFNGYVDHGSDGWDKKDLDEIFKDKETFLDILYNGYMCITNDNGGDPYESEDSWNYSKKFVPDKTKKYWVKTN